ncbi:MAG TPA: hypothetical protein VD741_06850 [Solirubrobacterales bacterium]|nr:hypothetical protein [Solirubrobacterales bacterium]
MNKALLAVLAALALIAAVVTGCGSDSETDSETTATITKAELIKEGDQICKKANEQSEGEAEEYAEENGFKLEDATEEQLEDAVREVLVPNLTQQAEDIEALGAPEGDEEQVEEIIVSLEDAAGEIEDDPGIVFEGKVLEKPSQLAEDYGFEVCGEE